MNQKSGITCVHGFSGNCRKALYGTTNNHVEKQKHLIKRKYKQKTNDKVIANKQPNVRKRVDSKRAELSKSPRHANIVLDFSSIKHFNGN